MIFGNNNIKSIEGIQSRCPSCPSCSRYNPCYCDVQGFEIVDYSVADAAKKGYLISVSIDSNANQSGVITPRRHSDII